MPLSLLLYMTVHALAYWVGPSCDGVEAAEYATAYWQQVRRDTIEKHRLHHRGGGGVTIGRSRPYHHY
jgi:hypothetical protein